MNGDFFASFDPNVKTPIGYSEFLKQYEELINNQKFAPVNIIAAPEGSGKRVVAEYLASKLLGKSAERYSELNLHPDLLIIDSANETTIKQEITVDSARRIKNFMQLTGAESATKIVIIDAIDKLNNNAANAILKILEEPPSHSYFLLICHNPENILDTILSRSQKIKLPLLSHQDFNMILNDNDIAGNQEDLYQIFPHQPGRAIEFLASQGLDMIDGIEAILGNNNPNSEKKFIAKYNFKKELKLFDNFITSIYFLIYRKQNDNIKNLEIINNLNSFSEEFLRDANAVKRLNLDRENFIFNNLLKLQKLYAT